MVSVEEYVEKNCKYCKNKLNDLDLCNIVKSKNTGKWNCSNFEEKIKMKNKIYYATADEDYGGTYIAAINIKEAKKIALGSDIISNHLENFIDLQIHWKRGKTTNYEGELDIKQINELGLVWWECSECGNEEFEIIDEYNYKCKRCMSIQEIPYIQ